MNIHDLSVNQLKRAAAIKEQIERLNKELSASLGAPARSRAAPRINRAMSVSARKKIAAAQKARWANLRRAKPPTQSANPSTKTKKKRVSRATKAKLSAKLKAYWATKRKAGKK